MLGHLLVRSLIRSFARTAHLIASCALLAMFVGATALIGSLACSRTPELLGKCMIGCLKLSWFCPTVQAGFRAFRHFVRPAKRSFLQAGGHAGSQATISRLIWLTSSLSAIKQSSDHQAIKWSSDYGSLTFKQTSCRPAIKKFPGILVDIWPPGDRTVFGIQANL